MQIALLGGGWRWEGDEGPFGPFKRRLKCKSPLRMCISTIYEYLLIFFLPLSLSSVLSLSSPLPPFSASLRNGKTFASSAHFIPQNVSLTFFLYAQCFITLQLFDDSFIGHFLLEKKKKETHFFACSWRTEKLQGKEREGKRAKTTRILQNYGQFFIEFKWVD